MCPQSTLMKHTAEAECDPNRLRDSASCPKTARQPGNRGPYVDCPEIHAPQTYTTDAPRTPPRQTGTRGFGPLDHRTT